MNCLSRFLAASAWAALLVGCQSVETLKENPGAQVVPDAAPSGFSKHIVMTLPRPLPPPPDPLALDRRLPEPGIPAVVKSLTIPEESKKRSAPESVYDVPLLEPQMAAAPPMQTPYFPKGSRGLAVPDSVPKAQASKIVLSGSAPRPPSEEPAEETKQADAKPQPASTARPPAAGTPAAAGPQVSRQAVTGPAAETPAAGMQELDIEQSYRDLLARRGDRVAIDLEGGGWIYVGLNAGRVTGSASRQGIEFLSRRVFSNKTSFSFEASEYGEYELSFQFQDNQKAVARNQIVHLQVLPEDDFAAALARQQGGLPGQTETAAVRFAPEPGPRIERAELLFDLGEYELALVEYNRYMRSGDPYLNDRIAACYAATGEPLSAVKYYRENLGLDGAYGDRAAVGLVRASIALEDSQMLLEGLPLLFGLESVEIGGELLDAARIQTEAQRYETAIEALQQYISRYPAGRRLDEVYYRLACIFEVDSPYRNLQSARDYYALLYAEFPESRYADRAEERLNYLDRYFFLVQ